jgi:hypothetical protein
MCAPKKPAAPISSHPVINNGSFWNMYEMNFQSPLADIGMCGPALSQTRYQPRDFVKYTF